MNIKSILVYLLFCVSTTVWAGQSEERVGSESRDITKTALKNIWISGGFGLGKDIFDMPLILDMTYAHRSYYGKIKYGFFPEEGIELFGPTPAEDGWEVGFLVGVRSVERFVQINVGGGIGVFSQVRRGSPLPQQRIFTLNLTPTRHEKETIHSVSIPLEAGVIFTPIPYLGIGGEVYASIKEDDSKAGIQLKMVIGLLR